MTDGIRLTRATHFAAFLLAALLAVACGGSGDAPAEAAGSGERTSGRAEASEKQPAASADKAPVDLAIEIANKIQADPDGIIEILEEYGMTEEELDELLYKIAADPELRKIYNEATSE